MIKYFCSHFHFQMSSLRKQDRLELNTKLVIVRAIPEDKLYVLFPKKLNHEKIWNLGFEFRLKPYLFFVIH